MHIFIEGEKYPLHLVEQMFDDSKFYTINGSEGIITSVGYYHSFDKGKLVFMLPKVFMRDSTKTIFEIDRSELVELIHNISVKHKAEHNWVRQLSVYFYNSLLEYRKRYNNSSIIHKTQTFELNSNIDLKDYSYLDILLSMVNFYKKNKQQILFKYIEFVSSLVRKPRWEKTVRKSNPILIGAGTPIYMEISNKKKVINNEEDLIIYFMSILNHLNKQHYLNLKIDKVFPLIEGSSFDALCHRGLSKLKKIKYRYFSDVLRRMYAFCEMYFSQLDRSSVKRKKEDYMAIANYNIVFEDMIDKLLSDELNDDEIDGITIDKLKHNDDGKIIDHVFNYKSLIDTGNIFYIGDSKYYKSDNQAGRLSKYKQFTYAKNVIQFNIDRLNRSGERDLLPLRYRDSFTDGYNISPNFFMYGYIEDENDYDKHSITKKGEPIFSYHYKDRLFDRDTLFVHQYQINFLYVLKAYTTFNTLSIYNFRREVREEIRNNFITFFNDKKACGFTLYQYTPSEEEQASFIRDNFKRVNGKIYKTKDDRLLLAVHQSDGSLYDILDYFKPIHIH